MDETMISGADARSGRECVECIENADVAPKAGRECLENKGVDARAGCECMKNSDVDPKAGCECIKIIDAHCHLDGEEGVDRILERARAVGIGHLVVNGLWRAAGDFGVALDLARRHSDFISATVAIHPHDAAAAGEADFERVRGLAQEPLVRAIGETGLDYHYNLSPPGVQREAMRRHIRLARAVQKPLVLHIREAHGDALDIFQEEGATGHPTQVHCFTGTPDEARAWVELGCHISFSGALTFKNGESIRAAARIVPLDRLLVETDSPYLAPVPHRGKRCEPAFVVETLRVLAEVRGLSLDEMAAVTTHNAIRLFHLPLCLDTARGEAFP